MKIISKFYLFYLSLSALAINSLAISTPLIGIDSRSTKSNCLGHYKQVKNSPSDYFQGLVDQDLLTFVNVELEALKTSSNLPSNLNLNQPQFLAVKEVKEKFLDLSTLSDQRLKQELTEATLSLLEKEDSILLENNLSSKKRIDSVSTLVAERILDSLFFHPTVAEIHNDNYLVPNAKELFKDVGYCFGRAMYVHEVLLKLGVSKNAIKKIWAVGPMKSDGILWDFHVATMVKLDNGKWAVIDSIFKDKLTGKARLLSPREWHENYAKETDNMNLRTYITEANKLGSLPGKYSPIQLGLPLPRNSDAYLGFFTDLQLWLKTMDMEKLLRFLKLDRPPKRPDVFYSQRNLNYYQQPLPKKSLSEAYGIHN